MIPEENRRNKERAKGGVLHVVHTNCQRIAWHRFESDYLENVCGQPLRPTASRFRQMGKRRSGSSLAQGPVLDPLQRVENDW